MRADASHLLARSGALARLIGFRSLARHPPCGRPSGAGLPAWEGYSNISLAVTRITFARPRTPLGMGMPSAVAVFWFPTQNLVHEIGRAVKHRPEVRSVEHQPSRLDVSLEMRAWSAASRSPPKY